MVADQRIRPSGANELLAAQMAGHAALQMLGDVREDQPVQPPPDPSLRPHHAEVRASERHPRAGRRSPHRFRRGQADRIDAAGNFVEEFRDRAIAEDELVGIHHEKPFAAAPRQTGGEDRRLPILERLRAGAAELGPEGLVAFDEHHAGTERHLRRLAVVVDHHLVGPGVGVPAGELLDDVRRLLDQRNRRVAGHLAMPATGPTTVRKGRVGVKSIPSNDIPRFLQVIRL